MTDWEEDEEEKGERLQAVRPEVSALTSGRRDSVCVALSLACLKLL